MISAWVSRASAITLGVAGLAFLFAADAILPRLIPEFPARAAWLGQIIAASWVALGALNWLSRSQLLGGIYGRAVVSANATYYFVAALSLLNFHDADSTAAFRLLLALHAVFALVYCFLLFMGPFERDLREHAGAMQ